MKSSTWTPAMHAVLDGEASAQETAALQARLAADPEARIEFQRLQSLFGQLAAMEPEYPPEGLVAAVSAAIGEYSRTDQPFGNTGVLGSTARDVGLDESSNQPHAGESPPFSFMYRESSMEQQSNTLRGNRKVWVGGGIAVVAAAVAIAFGMGGTPRDQDVNGTIVAAERYRAPQASTGSVQLADMSVAELLQNDAFLKVVKDPQVQALMVEPDFEPAARLILDNPDGVRRALAGEPDPQRTAAFRALLVHPDAAKTLMAAPQANFAILNNPKASLAFVPAEARTQFSAQNAELANKLPVSTLIQSVSGVPTAGATALGVPTAGATALGVPTAGATASGVPTAGATASGVPTAGATALGVPTAGATALGVPTAGATALGVPTAGATALGVPTAGATALGVPTAGATALGVPTAGATALGVPTAGATALGVPTAGATALGVPTAGATALGAPTAGATALGAPTAGATALGVPTANQSSTASGAPATNNRPGQQ